MRLTRFTVSAVAAVCALGVAGCSSSKPAPEPAPSTPSASPSPTQDPNATAALAAYKGLIATMVSMDKYAQPSNDVYKYASGAALTMTLGSVDTMRKGGIVMTGSPVLRNVATTLDMSETPPTAVIASCLDSTHWGPVYMTDPSKSAEQVGHPNGPHPVQVVVQKQAAGWRVTQWTVDGSRSC